MKRIVCALLCVILAASVLAGCSAKPESGDKLKIVTTVFPVYDWVNAVLGDRKDKAEVVWLMDSGVDMHSYIASADDIIAVSECDLFVYVGGESDEWTKDVLREKHNEKRTELDLIDALGPYAKIEEKLEGMQTDGEDEEAETDEHIWLSLRNAAVLCGAICDTLSGLDPDGAAEYRKNADAYIAELNALDAEYSACVEAAPCRTLLFADRFPFGYLCGDYGIDSYAAFSGCSAESEASFETVTFLADKLNELKLGAVVILDGSDGKLADTVISASGAENVKKVTLDSMQSVTRGSEKTYIEVMKNDLVALRDALGSGD